MYLADKRWTAVEFKCRGSQPSRGLLASSHLLSRSRDGFIDYARCTRGKDIKRKRRRTVKREELRADLVNIIANRAKVPEVGLASSASSVSSRHDRRSYDSRRRERPVVGEIDFYRGEPRETHKQRIDALVRPSATWLSLLRNRRNARARTATHAAAFLPRCYTSFDTSARETHS